MFHYITPEQALKKGLSEDLEELKRRASSKERCHCCRAPVWKLANTGLCFTCTTGEWDNSDDYELIP